MIAFIWMAAIFARSLFDSRRAALEKVLGKPVGKQPTLFFSARLAANGLKAYEIAKRKGFEGVVAKDESSPYVEGRSMKWLKFKVKQEDEFIIAGYTAPAGAREHFGALLLAAHEGDELKYVGKVGHRFFAQHWRQLYRKFQPLVRQKPPVVDPPRERDVTWLCAPPGGANRLRRMDRRSQTAPARVSRAARRQARRRSHIAGGQMND